MTRPSNMSVRVMFYKSNVLKKYKNKMIIKQVVIQEVYVTVSFISEIKK